jgi:hypothetical protein
VVAAKDYAVYEEANYFSIVLNEQLDYQTIAKSLDGSLEGLIF